MSEPQPANDILGLDLNTLKINDDSTSDAPEVAKDDPSASAPVDATSPSAEQPPASTDPDANEDKKPREPRKKPYVNPERVKTGGAQREKLSDEQLAERMVRIREQNERIKQRRADVEQDELEFRKTQEAERAKAAKNKKVQENIDRAREQNARRKLDKIQSREWDSGKPGVKRAPDVPVAPARVPPSEGASIGIRGTARGSGGRGRGRGRGGAPPTSNANNADAAAELMTEPTTTAEAEVPG
ncbi:uncharacterized protein PHACADRAFT_144604 [Phanerochaete carnosa HHB-10118-sp]|uniref:Uncharacterized protein n=1 Tax=Phanerochaete carnosa (strain HHB-10118-sp) TaxID=650164 RepID=K5V041_PHACS|nr:uncharacterized protein PHACADRAFT_144604 [Phanerochaete carnosa HHB-10118-sp]EKM55801.1 hypothetical protein PHACADRAFT_144604 [Phanerochaete carnosa HHB-10118-sp]